MEYPNGQWEFCRNRNCGTSYFVYEDEINPGECSDCRGKAAEKRDRKTKELEKENIELKAQLAEARKDKD